GGGPGRAPVRAGSPRVPSESARHATPGPCGTGRGVVIDGAMAKTGIERLYFTGNDEADELLAREPLALLIGFVLDQQVPLERAFAAPAELRRRIGGLDAATIARMETGELERVFAERPALHRFPGTMARRGPDL